ncbi:phenylacetic acid degradation bifunctional protein PaaZ [Hoeflea sp. WL0058]|uniref:Phenylacetic acid degradation bifunctional protein PaaZ n=1 Tax=Flavimaribacter sediminis TaxID=2865987 RepID=A0AAE3D0L8_9HYPH|nr:phenylacetic acid degradation bifunctional protein PaaZ [Flavimaribacter sediminis]MBW8636848.1 phenylacetic acid degradation bifunctional protein PaaZ [Flavimaribacter sediminis]
MGVMQVSSFAAGQWIAPSGTTSKLYSAANGQMIGEAGCDSLDFQQMLDFARDKGGPALRKMTFHDRARMLKALALYLNERRDGLYALSHMTGATLADSRIDIDGGIGTLLVYASKGRREMPADQVYVDGETEMLSREGTFIGRHVCTPLTGAAVHINAFNFPVWGMLEKLAPTLLAGVPAIVKPATATCWLTEACFKLMIESGVLPEGSIQLISGRTGDLLDRLDSRDVVSFTGSAATALSLRSKNNILANSVRFTAEQDSLNASVLGTDIDPGTPDFDIFIKEAATEITTKAGQKCTAIRRIIAPASRIDAVVEALTKRLEAVTIGDPALKESRMGALASAAQKRDTLENAARIGVECERVFGDEEAPELTGVGVEYGYYLKPMLFVCNDPDAAKAVHEVEAFGPVSTVMGYRDAEHAIALANRGGGSLVASVVTRDPQTAREFVLGAGASHGRIYFNNGDSAKEATGHGSPLPHMVHGGPGRAGGGEELGGVRGVMHYMQRTAIQASPDLMTGITGNWFRGSKEITAPAHPFTRSFGELQIGETIHTPSREVTLEDIEHFASFTGDTFYAHMDEAAAKANPFFPGRVAHGYLLLSFAAGLFVEPNPGPVLANTGLNSLSFQKPVSPGDAISVRLTVKRKTPRNEEYGEVAWDVVLTNQDGEQVAEYELLTMVSL